MSPFNLGGEMIRSVGLDRTTFNELPHKFEAGTPAIAEAVGFGAAIDYVGAIGLAGDRAARARAHRRTRWAGSAELDWMRVFGPPAERRAGIVSFEVEGVHPHDVAQILDWDGDRRPGRAPLHAAADDAPRRRRDDARELLPLLDRRTRSTASSTGLHKVKKSLG